MSYVLRLPPSLRQVSPSPTTPGTPVPAEPRPVTPALAVPSAPPAPCPAVGADEPPSSSSPRTATPLHAVVVVPEYEVVTTVERAEAVAAALAAEPVLALDIETFAAGTGACDGAALDCTKNRVRLVQLAARGRPTAIFDVAALRGLPENVGRLLSSGEIQKIGFNIRFDSRNLLHHFGIEVRAPVDLLAGAVLAHGYQDHRAKGAHTLQRLVESYLCRVLPKDEAVSDWGAPSLSREQLDYAARDAIVLLPLHDKICAAVQTRGVSKAWELENECIPAVVSMEEAGIDLDRSRLERLVASCQTEADAAALLAKRELGAINLNSPKQVIAAVQARYGVALTSTADDVLSEYAASAPGLQSLLTHRRATKRLDAGRVFIEGIQPDGRVRARFNPLAAPTGRFGCSSPNLLAVPKDADFRSCFVAGDGKKFVIADYSAIQLRIVADITRDPELVRCFSLMPPIDPHRRTASFITGKDMNGISKNERQLAKAVNFGLAFGMGARTFVRYARKDYGIELTVDEAVLFRERFLTLYQGIRDWHRRVTVEGPGQEGTRTGSGRFRRVTMKNGRFPFTDYLATPVQGTEADGVKRALALLHPRLARFGAEIVNVVHDEIVVRTPEHRADEVKALVIGAMVEGMQDFVTQVPVIVEAVVADTWMKA